MNGQSSHCKNVPGFGFASKCGPYSGLVQDLAIRQFAEFGGSAQDFQGTIVSARIIKMQAKRKHLFQNLDGRFDMRSAALDRPGPETGYINPLLNSNHPVLMPAQVPVARWSLVESQHPNRSRGT